MRIIIRILSKIRQIQLNTKNFLFNEFIGIIYYSKLSLEAKRVKDLSKINFLEILCPDKEKPDLLFYAENVQDFGNQLSRSYEQVVQAEEKKINDLLTDPTIPLFSKTKEIIEKEKKLSSQLNQLKQAIFTCFKERERYTPQQDENLYLGKGICHGAALSCAYNRLNNMRDPIRPTPQARFLQSCHNISVKKQVVHPFKISSSVLKHLKLKAEPVDMQRYFGRDAIMIEEFLNNLDHFRHEWKGSSSFILSRLYNLPDYDSVIKFENIQTNGHSIYFGLDPYELSDVNYPGTKCFSSPNLDEFKLLALGYFSIAPFFPITSILAISKTIPTEIA